MPELPEVEVIARGLDASIKGRTISAVHPVSPTRLSEPGASLSAQIKGKTVARVYRRAKVLLVEMTDGTTMAFHLKMTGRVVHGARRPAERHDRVLFDLDDGSGLIFSDMRKFGYVLSFAPGELDGWEFLRKVGPEPLDTPAPVLAERIRARKSAIKGVLLNQSVLVGVGNIYADESLFRAGIHPETKTNRVGRAQCEALCGHLQDVLKQAIAENGSSIRDYVNADGDAGAFQNSFNVYGRKGESCRACGSVLEAVRVAGRTSTFCPVCQPKR